jgi:hypothetical protein
VIRQVIDTTDFLTKAMGSPSKWVQAVRDTVIPMVSRLAPFQHAFVQRLSELGIGYHGSPIIEGAGKRYFDDSFRGGEGIRSRFLLLFDTGGADPSLKTAAQNLAEAFSHVVELRPAPGVPLTLVRPDGYIAYSARPHEGIAAVESMRSLLERQTRSDNQPVRAISA